MSYDEIQIVRVLLGPNRDQKGRLVRNEVVENIGWGTIMVAPGSTSTAEAIPGDSDTTYLTAYVPDHFLVGQDDYFIILGEQYDVMGQPALWRRAPGQTVVTPGRVVTLKRREN